MDEPNLSVSYFPGCSMATSAGEVSASLMRSCQLAGIELVEVPDWNCCGSSSGHAVDPDLGLSLCARILCRAPHGKPLMVMCPACYKNLAAALLTLKRDPGLRQREEARWGVAMDPKLEVVTFLELLLHVSRLAQMGAVNLPSLKGRLEGIKVAPYYGCMSMLPPKLRSADFRPTLMGRSLAGLGAEVKRWTYPHRCCGTFLTVARPEVTTPLVDQIMTAAEDSGADCLVTACAMCQLNLEVRCSLKAPLPTLHFSEVLALAMGAQDYQGWFKRHLVDPRPMLKERGLIA